MIGFNYAYKHYNYKGDVLWEQNFTPNNVAIEGWENIFNSYFLDKETPIKFQIGLLKEKPSVNSTMETIDELPKEKGYERKDIDKTSDSFLSVEEIDGGIKISTDTVEFENVSNEENWEPAKCAFLCAIIEENNGEEENGEEENNNYKEVLICYQELSEERILTSHDILTVRMMPKHIPVS